MTLAYFCSAVFSVALLSLLHTWKEEKNSWKSNAVAHSGRERQLGFAWPQWKITAVLCSVIHSRSHRIKESGYNRSRELNSAGIVHSWLWPVAFRLLPPSPRDSFPPHFCDLLFQSPRIFQLWVAEGEVHEPEYWIHNYQNNPSSSSSCSRLLSPVYWFRAAFQKKKKRPWEVWLLLLDSLNSDEILPVEPVQSLRVPKGRSEISANGQTGMSVFHSVGGGMPMW